MNIPQQQQKLIQLERTLGVPPGGPKAIALSLDFTATTIYKFDAQNLQARGFINMVQTLWVDNKASATILFIYIPSSAQTLQIPAGVQGYFTCICPNPIYMEFTSAGAALCQVTLLNFPVWS